MRSLRAAIVLCVTVLLGACTSEAPPDASASPPAGTAIATPTASEAGAVGPAPTAGTSPAPAGSPPAVSLHGATFAMPVDDEVGMAFADRGSLVATSMKAGPAPYWSKVLLADPARGPWRSVYASDAAYTFATLADGFMAILEYREQGGGAYSERVVFLDLPSGRASVIDSYALSATAYRGGGSAPPRPAGAAVLGGGLIAWVRLVEAAGGKITGELRAELPHLATTATLVAASDTWIRPVSIEAGTLVYGIARGNAAELRVRDLSSDAERVLATARLGESGGPAPFDPAARSGPWVGWIEETPPSGTATFATSALRAVHVGTGATRQLPLGESYCPELTGNARYFAANCSGPGTVPPRAVLLDTASWTEVPVARTTGNGPFSLVAAGLSELMWQDRVGGVRRVVLFTPTAPLRPGVASPAPALVTHENAALGYRIGLPPAYRRALSVVDQDRAGRDFYVPRSEEAERDLCQRTRDSGLPSSERIADLQIVVHPNSAGLSAIEFVSTPSRHAIFTSIEEVTIDGHDAARIVQLPSGDTAYYVIRANDRLYEVAPFIISQPSFGNAGGTDAAPVGWLDQIALTFTAIPFQTPAAPPSPGRPLCGN